MHQIMCGQQQWQVMQGNTTSMSYVHLGSTPWAPGGIFGEACNICMHGAVTLLLQTY